jgi:uncharacterized protein (TIGR03435 family)
MENVNRLSHTIGRSILVLVACSVAVGAVSAQTANEVPDSGAKVPEFEVAVIKPHPAGDGLSSIGGPPGRYEAKNVSVKMLVEDGFNLPSDQITGGPSWIESQRFDVSAKIPDAQWDQVKNEGYAHQHDAMRPMLQSLLKDRFRLSITHQPKELTVYALVVARGGSKLRPAGSPAPPPPSENAGFMMAMNQENTPLTELTNFLAGHFGRTVVDSTGLTGKFDISFYVAMPADHSPEEADSAIFRALEDQLGLKLVSRKDIVDTIVIEHLEQPSAN